MSDNKFLGGIKAAGRAMKNSPRLMRKKFSSLSHVGRSKDYSSLDSCEDNGWLHPDEKLLVGLQYHIKYLGSMEIDYKPNQATANNKMAIEVMRQVSHKPPHHDSLTLTISVGRITLTKPEDHGIIMRHSTSRIAYSTVDPEHPIHFCYVALPRKSKIALCHVFKTKNAKMSYELTFTCAQAFDLNYRTWQQNEDSASLKARASEQGDIEPTDAIPSPVLRRRLIAQKQTATGKSPLVQRKSAPPSSTSPTPQHDEVKPNEDVGYMDIGQLEVEDEESMAEAPTLMFGHVELAGQEHPHGLLEIGVSTEDFNRAKATHHDDDEDE